MIISKTPYRISFFGGGTDYPEWYLREGGAVLSTTIDKYCYISCRYLPPFFNVKHRIVWSHIETVSALHEILHPAVREGLKFLGFDDSAGLEIHHQGDLPARSGMGSSSTFVVGLIKALTALQGSTIGAHDLMLKAIELEQRVLKEHVGSQDQVAAACGGLNIIRFCTSGEIIVEPVGVPDERLRALQSNLLLIYMGTNRLASQIAGDIIANLRAKNAALRAIRGMVDEAAAMLRGSGSLDEFGRLLHETWMLKRDLSALVTNPTIDRAYKTALAHGALGGKLLGAGGAGFMMFYVPPDRQPAVVDALTGYLHVPFQFENEGSTLMYYGSRS